MPRVIRPRQAAITVRGLPPAPMFGPSGRARGSLDDEVVSRVGAPCHDGTSILSTNQISKVKKIANAEQKVFTQDDVQEGNRQLLLCWTRNGYSKKAYYGNDPRYLYILCPHSWDSVHASHELWRCDLTLFCKICGSTSTSSLLAERVLRFPQCLLKRLTLSWRGAHDHGGWHRGIPQGPAAANKLASRL